MVRARGLVRGTSVAVTKAPLREVRRYRALLDDADAARDPRELGLVAQRAQHQLELWITLQSLKEKLAERATVFGIRCRDTDQCFDNLISRVQTRPLFRERNVSRDELSGSLVDWAVSAVTAGSSGAVERVSTDDGRALDVELRIHEASKFAVRGHFWGPQDPTAAWRGRIELDVGIPPAFDDRAELRAVLARTIRHELEHAHDVDVPAVLLYDGEDQVEVFSDYILSPREVSAWSAHIADEARRTRTSIDDLLDGNRNIIERGALKRGANRNDAIALADDAVSAWRDALNVG